MSVSVCVFKCACINDGFILHRNLVGLKERMAAMVDELRWSVSIVSEASDNRSGSLNCQQ